MPEFLSSAMLDDMLASPRTFPTIDSPEGPIDIRHFVGDNETPPFLSHRGTNHTYEPSSPTYASLRRDFDEFLEVTAGSPEKRVLLTEGPHPDVNKDDLKEAFIRLGGESGWLYWMGAQENIETQRAEPPRNAEVPELLRRYSPEETFLFYTVRDLFEHYQMLKDEATNQSLRQATDAALRKSQKRFLPHEGIRAVMEELWSRPLTEADFSYEQFTQSHEALLGITPSAVPDDYYLELMTDDVYADKAGNPVTRVSEACSRLRDIHGASVILGHLAAGRSVFACAGWFHVRALEPISRNARHILAKQGIHF